MKAVFRFVLRWGTLAVVALAAVVGISYGIAGSTLNDLDEAAATAQRTGTAPPPNIPAYKTTALHIAAQVFALRQPGAETMREGRIFKDCEEICPDMVELPAVSQDSKKLHYNMLSFWTWSELMKER